MNWKKITAGISALAVTGTLLGAGLTNTAHAAAPTTPTTASEVEAQFSYRFAVWNGLKGVTLELAGVYGHGESHPPIGSTITYAQWQSFDVNDLGLSDSDVFVTYQVHVDGQGYVGDIQLQLSVNWNDEVTSRLSVNNTRYHMHLEGGAASPIVVFG